MSEFKVSAIFSNNMVIQRDKNINVFGTAPDGARITAKIGGNSATCTAKDGKFLCVLPPMSAQYGIEMSVSDGVTEKKFVNIAVGEVWLAGGQSNMELELQNSKNGREVLASIKDVNVRFYYTQKRGYIDEQFLKDEENTGWSECSPETASAWSAVGYYFGKKLSEELGVAVGIIGCNWGGTSASSWVEREVLETDSELRSYLDEYEEKSGGVTVEEHLKLMSEYRAYDTEWNKKSAQCYAENPNISWDEVQKICGENKWPGPAGPTNEFRPNGLYETMLMRVCPYSMRGFLYYQGESDDHKPRLYSKLLTRLIDNWRRSWNDLEMPFEIVQLPMFKYKNDPDYKHWCLVREAQERVFRTVKNTGLAVIIDCGEFDNIHPVDKEPVGERLALQTMKHVYGIECRADAPMLESFTYKDGGIELKLSSCDDGICVKGEPKGFELAGEDKKFVSVKPEISGDRVMLKSDEIAEPVYARYLWTNYGEVTLFNSVGLPCAPFRTHHNDEF